MSPRLELNLLPHILTILLHVPIVAQAAAGPFKDPLRPLQDEERRALSGAREVIVDPSSGPSERILAAWQLSREIQHAECLQVLAAGARDYPMEIGRICVQGIAFLRTEEAVSTLIDLLGADDSSIRHEAYFFLQAIAVDPPHFGALGGETEEARQRRDREIAVITEWWAGERLRYQPRLQEIYGHLVEVAGDGTARESRRAEAIEDLAHMVSGELIPTIEAQIQAADGRSGYFLQLLGQIPDQRSVELILETAANSPHDSMRAAARFGLLALAGDVVSPAFSDTGAGEDAPYLFAAWWESHRDLARLSWNIAREPWSE